MVVKKTAMKHSLSILLFICVLASCKAPAFIIGMSEQSFKSQNRGVTLVQASTTETVYRKINYPFGKPADYKFFYFFNGRLDHVDEGVQSPDLIIQHNRN